MLTDPDVAVANPLSPARSAWFVRYATAVLMLNVAVVLWGAYVRATGSGAGCGSHWPLCNGEVIPRAPQAKTVIEFTHRITSGLALISVLALWWGSRSRFPKGSPVRTAAAASVIFILVEALLGAGLVLFQYVAQNASIARAFYLSAHLANTLILLGCLAATVWLSEYRFRPLPWNKRSGLAFAALGCAMLASISGAVAALGDTLFPATSFTEGLRQELSSTAHILLRLRVFHPALAVVSTVCAVAAAVTSLRTSSSAHRNIARSVLGLAFLQLAAGSLNVVLLAPVWMQLVHLLIADLLWIALVVLLLAVLAPDTLGVHT